MCENTHAEARVPPPSIFSQRRKKKRQMSTTRGNPDVGHGHQGGWERSGKVFGGGCNPNLREGWALVGSRSERYEPTTVGGWAGGQGSGGGAARERGVGERGRGHPSSPHRLIAPAGAATLSRSSHGKVVDERTECGVVCARASRPCLGRARSPRHIELHSRRVGRPPRDALNSKTTRARRRGRSWCLAASRPPPSPPSRCSRCQKHQSGATAC